MNSAALILLKNNSVQTCLPVAISVAIYFLLIGDARWSANDDLAMVMFGAGSFITSIPSSEMYFINSIFGMVIKFLYGLNANLPMYGMLFISLVALSILMLNYALLTQVPSVCRPIFFELLVLDSATFFCSAMNLQFTSVAGIVSLGSSLFVISTIIDPSNNAKLSRLFFGVFVFIVGASIRLQSSLMVILLVLPITLFSLKNNLIVAIKQRTESTVRYYCLLKRTLFCTALVLTGYLILYAVDSNVYSTEDWKYWIELNNVKSEFTDFNRIPMNESVVEVFRQFGLDQIDYKMIKSWAYIDQYFYNADLLNNIVKRLADLNLLIEPKFNINTILNATEFLLYRSSLIVVCWIGLFLSVLRTSGVSKLFILVILPTTIIYVYVAVFLHRPELRVLIILSFFMLWSTAWVLYSNLSLMRNDHIHHSNNLRCNSIDKMRIALYFTIFTFMVVAYRNEIVNIQKNYLKLVETVNTWSKRSADSDVILIMGGSFCYECISPFSSISPFKVSGVIAAGWPNQSPHQLNNIKAAGLPINNFYKALAERGNVYIYNPPDYIVDLLTEFYREKFGIKFELRPDSSLIGLSRFNFYRR